LSLTVCQTAYRFETIQRVLGELAHARVGTPLRYALCRVWVETLAGPKLPLHLYIDVHLKPHWTQIFMPCGHVAMLNRVMPCTRQIIVTNPEGYVWEILDQVGDAHLSHDLPALEQELEQVTRHLVTLTIVDREANGLEVAQMYAKSRHFALLTLLDNPVAEALIFGTPEASDIFRLTGRWQPLMTERGMSLAPAVWGSARTEPADPRVFWLVREDATNSLRAAYSLSQSVADCAPDAAALLHGSGARAVYRARWPAMEGVIREMIAGANLNENYGYEVYEVPNRLRQRQFEEATALVGVSQKQLDHVQEQMVRAQTQLSERAETLAAHQTELAQVQLQRETERQTRQQAGQATRRVEQQLAAVERQCQILGERAAHLTERAQTGPLAKLNGRQGELEVKLVERQAAVAAIDLTQPMFERDLEKDQIMVDFQAALLNAHHWCGEHYFSGEWSRLELETATARIYRQRGHVLYTDDQVTVTLAAFADRAEQGLAAAACIKFNAAQIHDAAGRLIVMSVGPFAHCVRQL
jgi:hypothetical protein